MIFTNARLIFSDGIRDRLELVANEGKIAAIREQTRARGKDVIDLGGNYLAPGFVDLHVHGAVGRDTMEASAEAFRAICGFHATGGTTSLLLTTATAPMDNLIAVLNAVQSCRSSISGIAGVHVEGPFISKAKCGAQRVDLVQDPLPVAIRPLLEHPDVIRRVTIAPELPGALEAIENFHGHGISVSGGHSDAWDENARGAFDRGMRSVTHTFNCMSSARRRGIYRVKMLYRAKGPAGICLVTDATAGAGLPDGSQFSLFGNDCIVEGGVCLLADRSALAGSASRMIDLVRTLVNDIEVPLHEAIAMATRNAARAIGLKMKGQLAIGTHADLVVLSPDLEVQRTFAAGEEIFSLDRQ